MFHRILEELKEHLPFTTLGAVLGLIVMLFCYRLPKDISFTIFYTLHPAHVFLSALATASVYKKYKKDKCNFFVLLLIGYFGAIGVATLSDCTMPFLAEKMLNMPHSRHHVGFIEKWWLVNPLALLGVIIAFFKPVSKLSHSGHVFLSIAATLFHIIMAVGASLTFVMYIVIFLFLVVAVLVPCCLSDIIFPLLFLKEKKHKDSCKCRS